MEFSDYNNLNNNIFSNGNQLYNISNKKNMSSSDNSEEDFNEDCFSSIHKEKLSNNVLQTDIDNNCFSNKHLLDVSKIPFQTEDSFSKLDMFRSDYFPGNQSDILTDDLSSTSSLSLCSSIESTSAYNDAFLQYQYKLRPLKIKCLQSVRDLGITCEKLGLKFCPTDFTLNAEAMKYNHFIRKCSISALYPYEAFNVICKNLGLRFNSGDTQLIKRKVDLILGHKFQKGSVFYLVKWKRMPLKRNSYIAKSAMLPTYRNAIAYYNAVSHPIAHVNQEMINYFFHDLISRKPYDYLTLLKVCALISGVPEDDIKRLCLSFTELKHKGKALLAKPANKLKKIQSDLFALMQFSERRKAVLINLHEWERDINNFNPATYIEVENNVDLELAPSNFQFIHDYVRNQEIEEEPVCFCNCDNCYENKKLCCPHDSDGAFPYNKYRRLQLLPGYPIYECNKLCKCGDDCVNRVVQHGQKVKVAIFRTSNGCGWGLKTLEVINKDQFVLEYLGEIITSEEAEARGETYDFIGRTYLFDLDYGEGNCLYTVDAGHMGNAGHFINHSCEPNLHVFAVWINQPDPNLPRLALFANKRIERGEELTFDYKMVKNRDGFGVSSSPPIGIECKCNSTKCRKYLF